MKVKSVKPCLKQLQQSIQTIMSPSWPADEVVTGSNIGDMFIWMPKDHLYVLVYLVTVMHSMQAGYMDKAQKYTDKALTQIEKLKSKYNFQIQQFFLTKLLYFYNINIYIVQQLLTTSQYYLFSN